jgi:zinc D-Ala-D-Ala carboxypeptidase
MYGWSRKYPLAVLSRSATAEARGYDNTPPRGEVRRNLSRVSDLLATIPFDLRVNSGYRSPQANAAVGGAGKSQHMTGEAADVSPIGLSNRDLAVWLYNYRDRLKDLDQVIWYTDTSHIHISVGGNRRKEFYQGSKEGGVYLPWGPTTTDQARMAATVAANRPLQTAVGLWIGISVLGAVALGGAIWWRQRKVAPSRR